MSAAHDYWKSPAWAFQDKQDARLDLLGVSTVFAAGGDWGVFGPWTGNVFYVSDGGSDTNLGTTPDTPLLTITTALGKVTDGNNDVIVVLDYAGTSRAAETFPIALTTSHDNLSIIGVPYGNIGSNAIYPTSATTAAFTVTGTGQLKLVNLNIGGYDSGDYAIHYPSGTAWRNAILGCHFGTSGTTGWGIYVESDPPQLLVQGCDFHSGLSSGGIYISNCTRGDIIGNSFHVNSGDRGIQFSTSQADFGKILNNTFFVDDAAHGEAVYCSGALAGGIEMIHGNVAIPHGVSGGTRYTFDYEPYWWGGSSDPGVGLGANIPDPVEQFLELRPVPRGSLFFVDATNGSDTYDGLTPAMAKATITAAMALTTSGKDDCIVILDYYLMTNEAAEPIPVAKTDIHFIGKPVAAGENQNPVLVFPTGDTSAFQLANGANNVSFHNLEIDGGATAACIDTASGYVAAWRVTIDKCNFGVLGNVKYGILVNSGDDLPYLTIKNCYFGQSITDDAIEIAGNATRAVIKDNFFGTLASNKKGIDLSGNCVGVKILRNFFDCTDVDGGAIYMSSGCAQCFAGSNRAACGEDAAITNQLYYDGGSNSWVDNMTSDPTDTASLYEVD